jgi:molecular chaperone HscB
MKLEDNDFELFGLPQRFEQNRSEVDRVWRKLQSEVHPDRFASQGPAAQRVAMQWAVRVNEAYARLKDPMARAAYLCELRGAAIQAEQNTAMPAPFLLQQMEWRERLDEASGPAALGELSDDLEALASSMTDDLARLLDLENDPRSAANTVRSMMFLKRLRLDIEQRMERAGL